MVSLNKTQVWSTETSGGINEAFSDIAGEAAEYYLRGLEGSRFFVNNPNATTTCGCGASFSV